MSVAPIVPRRTKLLTVKVVAERLNLSTRTIRRMIGRGELPAHRLGSAVRISEDDLESCLYRVRR